MPISLQHILDAVDGATSNLPDVPSIVIEQVTADSRAVQQGSLFVAVPGLQVDGHSFIGAALDNGAAAIMGELSVEQIQANWNVALREIPYIQIPRARFALAQACAALYGHPSRAMTVIGVTGTDGKTTTCTLIESILQAHTQKTGTVDGTAGDNVRGAVGVLTTVGARIRGREIDTGFHVTTPDAPEVQRFLAEMRAAGCTHAVVESTSHGLDQGRVAAIDFHVAAVTNITHEHLNYHGSREAYVAAKALLLRALYHSESKPGVPQCAVLNRDDAGSYAALEAVLSDEAARTGRTVLQRVYGLEAPADVYPRNVVYRPHATELEVVWWGGEFPLRSPLIGEFNVYNMLCAATVALALRIDPETVQQGIEAVSGVIGRMERIDEGQPFLAVVDFAHSPVSLERALDTLRPLVGVRPDGSPGRLIAVFGSAGLRDRAKRGLMGAVSGRLADYTIVTAEDPRTESLAEINREIEQGLLNAGAEGRYTIIDDRAAAIRAAVERAQPGDVVAAFGKGHERSMCFGTTEYPWSDQDAMRDALQGLVHDSFSP